MIIIILGPQGSGKGTQAKILAREHNLFHLSTGDILRELSREDDEIAEKLALGELFDDDFIVDTLKKYLTEKNILDNIILDGSPRSVKQYVLLKEWLATLNKKFDYGIYLALSDEAAIERLSARRQNKKTGEIYNLITNPPPENVLEEDLLIREDDKPEAIMERLSLYHAETEPILDLLKKDGILSEIDGSLSIAEIASKIKDIVK